MRNLVASAVLVSRWLASTAAQSISQSTSPVTVIGTKSGIDPSTGSRPARQNIEGLYTRGGAQWDLYIQALAAFQATVETDEMSYFQICGIHGLPFVSWNGVDQVPGAPDTGYCPHGEILFATWHRPFVALFEQQLLSHASTIANQYPADTKAVYQEAAAQLRQPYWDWAENSSLPLAVTLINVTVNSPAGGTVSIPNPLYQYRFQTQPKGNGFDGKPLAQAMQTLRCPDPGTLANNESWSDFELNTQAKQLSSYTYDTFVRSTNFQDMASMDGGGASSFEAPHNLVHDTAGCSNGSLGDLYFSAFDPVFMLLHANLDRLVAMWQAIYFNSSMDISAVTQGVFATPKGTNLTADSPLKPFFDANLNYHTSHGVARMATFGYTYPEIDDWSTTPAELSASVRAAVNVLYGPSPASSKQRDARMFSQSQYYTAEVAVDRTDLPLPCSVVLLAHGSVLGRMALLAAPSTGTATVSLPLSNLSGNLGLTDMAVDTVIPFLKEKIEIQVRRRDGTLVPLAAIPSLQVHVQAVDYMPSQSQSEFPSFGKAARWPVHVAREP